MITASISSAPSSRALAACATLPSVVSKPKGNPTTVLIFVVLSANFSLANDTYVGLIVMELKFSSPTLSKYSSISSSLIMLFKFIQLIRLANSFEFFILYII